MWYSISASSSKLQEMKTIMEKESFGINSQIRYHYNYISVWLQRGCFLTYLGEIKGAGSSWWRAVSPRPRCRTETSPTPRAEPQGCHSWNQGLRLIKGDIFMYPLWRSGREPSAVLNCMCPTPSWVAISCPHAPTAARARALSPSRA